MRVKLNSWIMPRERPASVAEQLHQRHIDQRHVARRRLGISDAMVAHMVKQFIALRGGVTICPPVHALPSRQYNA